MGTKQYASPDLISRDFDHVYRAKETRFPLATDDVIIGIVAGRADVYWKPKGEEFYEQLSSASYTKRKKESVERGGTLKLTSSSLNQSFENNIVTIKWAAAHQDTSGLGIASEDKDFAVINLDKCEKLK